MWAGGMRDRSRCQTVSSQATCLFCELITSCPKAGFKDVLLVVGMDIPADCEFKRTLK